MRTVRTLMWAATALLVLVVVAVVGLRTAASRFFYPAAPPMPPVVERPISEILQELERQMEREAPLMLESLQPGLSDEEIAELERKGGFKLPEDMKALYRWHNGCRDWEIPQEPGPAMITVGPIPGHRFMPLDEAIAQRDAMAEEARSGPLGGRLLLPIVAGHRDAWITVFGDMCGDGYFFDPHRSEQEGAVFYCFAEDGTYDFFPSVKNLLAWAVKCYEVGAFRWQSGPEVSDLKEDFERSWELRREFASSTF